MNRIVFFLIVVGCIAVGFGAEVAPNFHFPRLVQMPMLMIICLAAIWRSGRQPSDAVLVALSLLFGLIVIEAGMAWSEPPMPKRYVRDLIVPRPIVGWGPSHPGVFHARKVAPDGRVVFDVHYTINKDLIRDTKVASGPGQVDFFGDSWTFGDGVNDEDTLPQSFANLYQGKLPVLNLGFSAWSPAQNLASLQTGLFKTLIKEPRHFILTTAPWHIERTGCKILLEAPRYVIDGDGVRFAGQCENAAGRIWRGFFERFAMYHVLVRPFVARLTPTDAETYLKIIETFVRTAEKDYGVKTTVVYLPYDDGYLKGTGFTGDKLVASLREAGVDVLVDALPPIPNPSLYKIRGDDHPTGLGNRARAKEIQAHLEKEDASLEELAAQPAP